MESEKRELELQLSLTPSRATTHVICSERVLLSKRSREGIVMCGMNDLLTVGTIAYDKRNEGVGDGYGYASDEAITTAFREVMHKAGLHVKSFEIVSSEMGEVETQP